MRLGLDPGFGNFKLASPHQAVAIPSVVGIGDTDIGALSIGDLGKRRYRLPDQVGFEGLAYLVGPHVSENTRPTQRMDLERLGEGPELKALFYAATFHLLGSGEHEASCVVGFPIEVMIDRSMARSTLRNLRNWIIGTHNSTLNGEPLEITISSVRAMAQPAGAFFAWGLNAEGGWKRSNEALKGQVGVCDIGFNTLDLLSLKGGAVTRRYTGGDTLGMRRAAEALRSTVRARWGVELAATEADELLRADSPELYSAEGHHDLRDTVNQSISTATAGITNFIEERWGNGKQFYKLFFTGGGAATLRNQLLSRWPHGIISPNPITANAVGLAKFAQRDW